MTPVGCAVGPPITGQLTLKGIPVLGLVDTGASMTCMGFSVWWKYRAQWGPLKPFGGIVHGTQGETSARRSREISANCGENTAFRPAMGQSTRASMLHRHHWAGIATLLDRDGHHAAAPRTH